MSQLEQSSSRKLNDKSESAQQPFVKFKLNKGFIKFNDNNNTQVAMALRVGFQAFQGRVSGDASSVPGRPLLGSQGASSRSPRSASSKDSWVMHILKMVGAQK